MTDIRLTKNFLLSEFVASSTAKAKKIDNTPNEKVAANLKNLCEQVLQPLRDWYGSGIKISSGYRCKKLNTAVGGVKNSQHMTGEAADLHLPSLEIGRKWFEYIKEHLPHDQVIWEHSKSGVYWIHVSCKIDLTKNRNKAINDLLKK